MRPLALLCCLFFAVSAFAQNALSLGQSSVSAVLDQYTMNPLALVPETHKPLPYNGKWSIRTTRPESCPHDDTPCARVLYTVAEAHVTCEWTVVPQQGSTPAAFLDENEDASRYLLRKLPAGDLASLVLTSPQPVYPPIARAAHVDGSVVVRLVVSGNGSVLSATPISGPPMLRGAATDAAKHWTLHALQVGSQSTPFAADVSANFSLDVKSAGCNKDNFCKELPIGTVSMLP